MWMVTIRIMLKEFLFMFMLILVLWPGKKKPVAEAPTEKEPDGYHVHRDIEAESGLSVVEPFYPMEERVNFRRFPILFWSLCLWRRGYRALM